MKRYLRNLWTALTGGDPFREELDEKARQLDRAAENLSAVKEQLCETLEKWDAAKKEASGQQQLVENLRGRIAEKDGLIAQMKDEYWKGEVEYKERIADYSSQVAKLQGELKGRRKKSKKQAKTE